MGQEIAVIIIFLLALAYLVYAVWKSVNKRDCTKECNCSNKVNFMEIEKKINQNKTFKKS